MTNRVRNLLKGTVAAIKAGELNSEIEVELASKHRLIAMVSNETRDALALTVGAAVVVLVKASGIIVATNLDGLQSSARNQLAGTVASVERCAVDAVVTIDLGGVQMCADITLQSADSLQLAEGTPATLLFKASNVLLGTEQTWLRELFLQRRNELGLSQRALAQRLGVIYSVVAKVESGEKRLDVFEFIHYCHALELDAVSALQQIQALVVESSQQSQ